MRQRLSELLVIFATLAAVIMFSWNVARPAIQAGWTAIDPRIEITRAQDGSVDVRFCLPEPWRWDDCGS